MKLTIAIDTLPQGRPRFTRRGVAYDPPDCRKFKARFALMFMSALGDNKPLKGAVKVSLKISRDKKSAISQNFGDVDNLAKIILDAITATGAVWRDDRQITELHVIKATAPKPSVELEIEEC